MEKQVNLPQHIAFILDGNGRYAKERGWARTAGHEEGIKALKECIKNVKEMGIPFMSVYAFSTENFKRPAAEVNYLINRALEEYKKAINDYDKLEENIRIIGERKGLSEEVLNAIDTINNKPYHANKFTLFVAFNYSSEDELVHAMNEIEKQGIEINKENIEKNLYTYPAPAIDLLVRTSGEMRLSGFMLYQASYAELYFTKTYWPAFNKESLDDAISEYQKRNRRFGKV